MPYKGVRNLNGRWVACINSQNLYFHAGSHGTEEAGAKSLDRFLYLLHKLHNFTWVEGVLQVGLTDEEKRELDELTLEDLQQQVKEEGAAAKKAALQTTSRYRGVTKKGDTWQTQIRRNGRMVHLGYFDDEANAAVAYDKAAVAFRGKSAIPNFSLANYPDELQEFEAKKASGSQDDIPGAKHARTRQRKNASPSKRPRPPRARGRRQPPAQPPQENEETPAQVANDETEAASMDSDDHSDCNSDSWDEASDSDNGNEPPPTLQQLCDPAMPWNQPLSPLDIPDGGMESPDDEEEKQRHFDAAMENPRFRLYMERRMTKGSNEPNLHIMGPVPFDPWPHVLPDTCEPRPRPPRRYDMYRAIARLVPGGFEGLLTDTESESESECEASWARGTVRSGPSSPQASTSRDCGPFSKRMRAADADMLQSIQPLISRVKAQLHEAENAAARLALDINADDLAATNAINREVGRAVSRQ